MATKIVALVGLSVVTLGANAKPYGGGGYYGKYGGGKYGGVSDSYDDGYYKGSKYGGVSDSYDDGYKGSKYGGYGYNAPKPKVSWWKPWSWKYAKKSYSYGDEYEYGYDNGLTKADLREAAHAYVGLSETLKRDEFQARPMTPGTTTTTNCCSSNSGKGTSRYAATCSNSCGDPGSRTTTTAIPKQDPNQFECTCGCNVGHQAFACISFFFDKDGAELTFSPIQTVYQSVGYNKFIGTSQEVFPEGEATTRFQGSSLAHYAGGEQTITITKTSVQFTDPTDPSFERAPFTALRLQDKVTCFVGPEPVFEACAERCKIAVDEKLVTENEFVHKCD